MYVHLTTIIQNLNFIEKDRNTSGIEREIKRKKRGNELPSPSNADELLNFVPMASACPTYSVIVYLNVVDLTKKINQTEQLLWR